MATRTAGFWLTVIENRTRSRRQALITLPEWKAESARMVSGPMRVAPSLRRRGIGTRLVRQFEEWARIHCTNELSVTAYSANEHAVEFYRGHGFIPFEITLHRSAPAA
jgi:GNAT superfamily N-acetyltransferase